MSRDRKVAGLVSLAVFMVFLDLTVVNVAFPRIRHDLASSSLGELSWVLSGYSIVFAALLVPAGYLGDRVGSVRIFSLGLAAFTAGSALCSASPTTSALIASRVLQGAGAALLVPAGQALLLAATPESSRAGAIGKLSAVGGIAAAAGPAIGGLLVSAAGWRTIFLINVPAGIVALAASRRLGDLGRRASSHAPDPAGIALIVVGAVGLVLAITQGQQWGWTDPRVVAGLAVACVAIPLIFRRCLRHPAPIIDLALFRQRGFAIGNAGSLIFGIAMYATLLGEALFLTGVWHYSVLRAGLAIAATPIASAASAPLAGSVADRRDPRLTALPGALAFVVGACWFAANLGPRPQFLSALLPGAVLLGLGLGLGYATLSAVSVRDVAPARFGIASGVNAMSRQLGAALGVALLVAVFGHPTPPQALDAFRHVWTLAAVAAAGAFLISTLLPAHRTQHPPGPATTGSVHLGSDDGGRERELPVAAQPQAAQPR